MEKEQKISFRYRDKVISHLESDKHDLDLAWEKTIKDMNHTIFLETFNNLRVNLSLKMLKCLPILKKYQPFDGIFFGPEEDEVCQLWNLLYKAIERKRPKTAD